MAPQCKAVWEAESILKGWLQKNKKNNKAFCGWCKQPLHDTPAFYETKLPRGHEVN